ncbi:MAG: hypothetical protein IKI56_05860, partial [Ruminococcus sp.]|nr:hypothetical protein [Ruminococcus sp.]
MHKRTNLRKKVLSLFVASAITCSQILTITPFKTSAAGAGRNISGTSRMLSGTINNGSTINGIENYIQSSVKNSAGYDLWTDSTSLPTSGKYILDCDVTASGITVSNSLDLDLNGHKINTGTINCTGSLTIRDTKKNGIVNSGTSSAVKLSDSGSFELAGGTVTSAGSETLSLGSSKGTVTLSGGYLKNTSKNTSESLSEGCAVLLGKGFTGTVKFIGTAVTSDIGPTVYGKDSKGTINISKGSIKSNSDFGLYVKGDTAINLQGNISVNGGKAGVYIPKDKALNVTGNVTGLSTSIFAEASGVLTNGLPKYFNARQVASYLSRMGINGKVFADESGELYFNLDEEMLKYQIFNTGITWDEAKEYCESLGGHLAAITSAEEQKIVNNAVTASGTPKAYLWIGGYCGSDRMFKWVTDEDMSYINWAEDQPDNAGGEDRMMLFRSNGGWNDDSNKGWNDNVNNMGFICEWDEPISEPYPE